MVNYLSVKKLVDEIDKLEKEKTKSYYFIFAKNEDDEINQIRGIEGKNRAIEDIVFIIVRKDK